MDETKVEMFVKIRHARKSILVDPSSSMTVADHVTDVAVFASYGAVREKKMILI